MTWCGGGGGGGGVWSSASFSIWSFRTRTPGVAFCHSEAVGSQYPAHGFKIFREAWVTDRGWHPVQLYIYDSLVFVDERYRISERQLNVVGTQTSFHSILYPEGEARLCWRLTFPQWDNSLVLHSQLPLPLLIWRQHSGLWDGVQNIMTFPRACVHVLWFKVNPHLVPFGMRNGIEYGWLALASWLGSKAFHQILGVEGLHSWCGCFPYPVNDVGCVCRPWISECWLECRDAGCVDAKTNRKIKTDTTLWF